MELTPRGFWRRLGGCLLEGLEVRAQRGRPAPRNAPAAPTGERRPVR